MPSARASMPLPAAALIQSRLVLMRFTLCHSARTQQDLFHQQVLVEGHAQPALAAHHSSKLHEIVGISMVFRHGNSLKALAVRAGSLSQIDCEPWRLDRI